MSLIVAGQLAGVAFACGLNLYLAVAALGILSRFGLLEGLPAGLQGLEGWLVILSALALYLVEAVVDKVNHADSLWDTLHTFIRPPAAALLAVGALWGEPAFLMATGVALAFFVALAAHVAKAGLRMALNTTMQSRWQAWISILEDVLAVAAAILALRFPEPTLAAVAGLLLIAAAFAPRLSRAFRLGTRCLGSWFRSIFTPPRWRDADEIPRWALALLDETPLGAAPPRGARAALHGLKGVGPFRNGWLVVDVHGSSFLFRTPFGNRRVDLPQPLEIRPVPGLWATLLRVRADSDVTYTIFLLKDGPETDLAIQHLSPTPA